MVELQTSEISGSSIMALAISQNIFLSLLEISFFVSVMEASSGSNHVL